MDADKFLLVKGVEGMGNRLLCALTGILYARLSERKLLIDWSDEFYSTDRTNVFHRFFQSPFCSPTDEIPVTDSVAPDVWRGHLHESALSMRRRFGNAVDPRSRRTLSVDLSRLDHPEDVAVLWLVNDQVDLLRPHFDGAWSEFVGASKQSILRKLLQEALILGPEIRERVDRFKRDHFRERTVGVHVRYSDHRTSLWGTLKGLDHLLEREPALRIFLATDNIQIRKLFDEIYPRVISTSHEYSPTPGRPLHHGSNRPDPTTSGIEALTDLYLLAECDDLIVDMSSSFARLATLLTQLPAGRVLNVKRRGKLSLRLRQATWRFMLKTGLYSWGLKLLGKLLRRRRSGTSEQDHASASSRDLLLEIYHRLKIKLGLAAHYPVLYNVNGVNESSCGKRALLIYVVKPFLTEEHDSRLLSHQNARQCKQIAEILGSFGYVVDAVDIRARGFRPSRAYDLIISNRSGFKVGDAPLERRATRVFLATVSNPRVHNQNLRRRHERLAQRRKCTIQMRRVYSEAMPYLAGADAIVGFGNEFVMRTWRETFEGPIYAFDNYGFRETEFRLDSKDFDAARKSFLYFASKSQVHKGLDLLLEIFPRHPDLHLYVCGPFEQEKDFCSCYHEELYATPNIHPVGWVRVNSPEFYELAQRCACVILPSCSEGQAGSVVQCMSAGLVPLVTKETGIDTEDFGITFPDDSIEQIERVVLEVAQRSAAFHRERSIRTRQVAERKYSESAFLERWRSILSQILGSVPADRSGPA